MKPPHHLLRAGKALTVWEGIILNTLLALNRQVILFDRRIFVRYETSTTSA